MSMRKYKVGLWCGAGYELHIEEVEAEHPQHALEVAVVQIEEKGLFGLFWDEVEMRDEMEQMGELIYVDATMDGAKEPHYVDGTNLRIEEV